MNASGEFAPLQQVCVFHELGHTFFNLQIKWSSELFDLGIIATIDSLNRIRRPLQLQCSGAFE